LAALTTNRLTEGTLLPSGIAATCGVAIDPSGKFLYAQTAFFKNALAAFGSDVNTGA